MEGILIIVIVVIVCHFWLYLSIKKRFDELSGKGLPPIVIHCTPQQGVAPGMAHIPQPQVSVSPTPSTDEELAAVIMAAIAAYENDMAEPMYETVTTGAFGKPSAEVMPARVYEVEKYKYKKQGQRWAATARYENHKRL